MPRRLSTTDVAERLGVKPATVYAYVSRGLLTSDRSAGGSTFDPAEVERLATAGRRPTPADREGPGWVSELTLIQGGRYWYRGVDAVGLVGERRFEEVAEWLWSGRWPDPAASSWPDPASEAAVAPAVAALPRWAGPLDRCKVLVATAATADPLLHDWTTSAVAAVGRELITLLADDLGRAGRRWDDSVAGRLAPGVCALEPSGARLAAIDTALVLLADHELAASTVAVRMAASFGSDPYSAVGAGLGVAAGTRHAGASSEVVALLAEARQLGPSAAVGERLRRGRPLPGLGQPLYPAGDPRAAPLLATVGRLGADPGRVAVIDGVLAVVAGRELPPPNVDFGLAAVVWALGGPPRAGEALFALPRIAGWLAHAVEQYGDPVGYRARAAYTGPRPSPS